jgi:hypothetical protein
MRIYDGEFTVGRILERCRIDPRDSMVPIRSRVADGVNLDELTHIINSIPVDKIQFRRQRLNKFYEEVLVSADPERGISFHSVLMILAHHNVITDSKSLRLEEFLRRRARLQRVEEAVRRNTVIGFFDTLYWSREFRRKVDRKKSARLSMIPTFTVPEIFVDDSGEADEDEPASGPLTPRVLSTSDDGLPMLSPSSRPRAESSPTPRQNNLPRLDTTNLSGRSSGTSSPAGDWTGYSPSRTPRHMYGERSPFDTEEPRASGSTAGMGGDHSRQNSAMSVRDVMDSLENSAWGASIRRSYTQRRSGGNRSGEP